MTRHATGTRRVHVFSARRLTKITTMQDVSFSMAHHTTFGSTVAGEIESATRRRKSVGSQQPRTIVSLILFFGLSGLLMLPALSSPAMQHDSFWIDLTWSEQFTAAL